MSVLARQLAILGKMVRQSRPLDGVEGPSLDDWPTRLFDLEGPDPEELPRLIDALLRCYAQTGDALLSGVSRTIVDSWIERNLDDLREAGQHFCKHYSETYDSVRRAVPAFPQFGGFVPSSVLESAFCCWLGTSQPAVLERVVALMMGVYLAGISSPRVIAATFEFVRDLRLLQDASRRVAGFLGDPSRRDNRIVEWLGNLGGILQQLQEAIEPILADIPRRGRPPSPFRSMAASVLRRAGLTDRDIAAAFDVSGDAVRKQRRSVATKSPRKSGKGRDARRLC